MRLAHPELGEFTMHNVFPKLSDTPGEIRWLGPTLGQHTEEVLRDVLGYEDDAVTALRDHGVIS